MRSFVRTLSLVLAVAMVVTTKAGAAQGPTVKGDPRALADVNAALGRLATLKTYRIKGTIRGGNTQAWEVVNPDRVHYTSTAGGGTIEAISVGKEMRSRDGAKWKCPKIPIATPSPITRVSVVAAHKGPIEAVGGVQTQTHTYTSFLRPSIGPTSMEVSIKLYVALDGGLPKRQQGLNEKGTVNFTWDYYDFNAPITIDLPSCG